MYLPLGTLTSPTLPRVSDHRRRPCHGPTDWTTTTLPFRLLRQFKKTTALPRVTPRTARTQRCSRTIPRARSHGNVINGGGQHDVIGWQCRHMSGEREGGDSRDTAECANIHSRSEEGDNGRETHTHTHTHI